MRKISHTAHVEFARLCNLAHTDKTGVSQHLRTVRLFDMTMFVSSNLVFEQHLNNSNLPKMLPLLIHGVLECFDGFVHVQ